MGMEAIFILILSVGVTAGTILLGLLLHELQVQDRAEERRHRERLHQWRELIEVASTAIAFAVTDERPPSLPKPPLASGS